jgi:hypothetical protein
MSKRPHRPLSGLGRAVPVLLLVASSLPLWSEKLPTSRPESVGLSSARLERLDRVMGESVEKGRLVAVFMTQLLPAGDLDVQAKFRSLVYQSIVN